MALEVCSGGLYSESTPAHTVDQLEALRTNIALGLGDEFALRPQPQKHHGRVIELEGGGGAHRRVITAH